jgi:hypothetical protein
VSHAVAPRNLIFTVVGQDRVDDQSCRAGLIARRIEIDQTSPSFRMFKSKCSTKSPNSSLHWGNDVYRSPHILRTTRNQPKSQIASLGCRLQHGERNLRNAIRAGLCVFVVIKGTEIDNLSVRISGPPVLLS